MDRKKVEVPLDRALRVGPPTSIVLATSISKEDRPNIIALGMYMPISSSPPLVAIGVSPRRYSHGLISETGEFIVNVPTKEIVKEVIYCGSVSGREHDKFKETGLTPIPASLVKPPMIKECVSNIECRVAASYTCGDHTLFLGEVVSAHVKEGLLKETLDVLTAQTISHKGPYYFAPELIYKV